MKRNGEAIDDLIREALGEADAALLDDFGEQTLPEMMTAVFQGRRRRGMILNTIVILAFFAMSIVCAIRLVGTVEPRSMSIWAIGLFVCWSSMIGFKIVSWMEMNRNALTREVKRLELQVAQLAKSVREK